MRDESLKLNAKCGHLKKPMDVVRYLEDELSKVESKLINFPELKLSEADKVSLILQAISADARQYVVLRDEDKYKNKKKKGAHARSASSDGSETSSSESEYRAAAMA